MVDVFEHSARLDTAAVEERRDLVQIIPDGGKLPCDGFNFVRVDIKNVWFFCAIKRPTCPTTCLFSRLFSLRILLRILGL